MKSGIGYATYESHLWKFINLNTMAPASIKASKSGLRVQSRDRLGETAVAIHMCLANLPTTPAAEQHEIVSRGSGLIGRTPRSAALTHLSTAEGTGDMWFESLLLHCNIRWPHLFGGWLSQPSWI